MRRGTRILTVVIAAGCWLAFPHSSAAASGVEVWQQIFGVKASSQDQLFGLAVDGNGDVIVTGHTDIAGNYYRDLATVKYSGSGGRLWTNRFEPAGDTYTESRGVAVNRVTGDVCVIGHSVHGSGYDYLAVAYSSDGSPLWTNRYNSGGSGDDIVSAVAADESSGNFYITGRSPGLDDSGDFATVAYSATGVPLWTNRYDGPASGDSPVALVVDAARGRLYVTGSSVGTNSFQDFATVAYSSGGVGLWTNRFNGSSNYSDNVSSVAVDIKNGNVYVFGTGLAGPYSGEYITLAYSSAGVPLWTNRFNDPLCGVVAGSVAADSASGNVFVTGSTYNGVGIGYDYATIAYSSSGVALWTNRYDDAVNNYDDVARAVVVDPINGRVYVAGFSLNDTAVKDCVTIAYTGAGSPLWTNRQPASAQDSSEPLKLGVDSATGRVFAGFRRADYITVAWSSGGVALWTNSYNGLKGIEDVLQAVALNRSNNAVYVTGYSRTNSSDTYGYDCQTVAYAYNGVPLWTNRFNGPVSANDQAQAVAVDETSGRVYVAGSATFTGLYTDLTVLTYSSAGVLLKTNRYNGTGNFHDAAKAIVVDGSSGRFYAAGYSTSSNSSSDFATVAYSSAGLPLWTNRYDPGYVRQDDARAIAVDETRSSVYVTGVSEGSSARDEIATVAYTTAGAALWTNRYASAYFADNTVEAIAVNRSNGCVYVAGYIPTTFTTYDFLALAYSSTGVPLWTNYFNYDTNVFYDGVDLARAVAVDESSGNVYVAGQFNRASAGVFCIGVLAYSSAGTPLWTNSYSGPGDTGGQARAVSVDRAGHVFVSGHSGSTNNDIVLLVYQANGTPIATNRYNGPPNRNDTLNTKASLAVAPAGVAIVAGNTVTATEDSDFVTLKYAFGPDITLQPASRTNNVWTTATFTVAAAGMSPPSYHWRREGLPLFDSANITGANSTQLSLDNLWFTNAASYSVIVSNEIGFTISLPATLTIVGMIPQFTKIDRLTNGVVQVSGDSEPNANLRIETSTNLLDWQTLTEFINLNTFTVSDGEAAGVPIRFYRALWLP